jgi:hypothetical protein
MKINVVLVTIFAISTTIQQGRNAVHTTQGEQTFFNPYSNPVVPYCFLGNEPVCSTNNETFINECVLILLGQQLKSRGWCFVEAPPQIEVKTNKNKNNGYATEGFKSLDKNCPVCNDIFNPVCGVNGVTYLNLCKLVECARIEKSNDGPCGVPDYKLPEIRECRCEFRFKPACGSDNVTYQDSCVLGCAGQSIQNEGSCIRKCGCTKIYRPVCGTNRQTYDNACEMRCDGELKLSDGVCPSSKPRGCEHCEGFNDAVCGTNGVTYDNMCYLQCGKAQLFSKGACPTAEVCSCHDRYVPVCGIDNKTYLNECYLNCKNVRKQYNGLCSSVQIDRNIYGKCNCGEENLPVCGGDGRTYLNTCFNGCLGRGEVVSRGECNVVSPTSCECADDYEPVCGDDLKTYRNSCISNCQNQNVRHPGKCQAVGYIGTDY